MYSKCSYRLTYLANNLLKPCLEFTTKKWYFWDTYEQNPLKLADTVESRKESAREARVYMQNTVLKRHFFRSEVLQLASWSRR